MTIYTAPGVALPLSVATVSSGSANKLPEIYMPAPSGDTSGATDGAAFTAALAALPSGGGTIVFGQGVYYDNTQRTIPNYVTIRGVGGLNAGGNAATILKYVGTAASYLNAASTYGFQIRDMWLWGSNASFTGILIDLSSAVLWRIERNLLYLTNTVSPIALKLDQAQEGIVYGNNIVNGQYGIQGMAASGHYANGIVVIGNRFGGQSTACVQGLGTGWHVAGNTFELGATIGIAEGPSASQGCSISGNWFGDSTGTHATIRVFATGLAIVGNFIGATTTSSAIQFAGTSDGVHIAGNYIASASIGVDKNAQTATAVGVGPNHYTTVTTPTNFTAAGTLYVE